MSYDLMVFSPSAAPPDHTAFMAWYRSQAKWEEGHGYQDPAVSTANLKAWFMDMIKVFPAMNGPHAGDDLPEDESLATDYSIGNSVIYACFAWSKAELAYRTVIELAQKHGLGFFNASSDGAEVWLPKNGKLVLAHSASSS